MADDNTLRPNRSNDPYRRAAEPSRPSEPVRASDPLAELARLIGQNDPFTQPARASARDPQRPANPAPAADWRPASTAEPDRYPSRDAYAEPEYAAHEYAAREEERSDPRERHQLYAEPEPVHAHGQAYDTHDPQEQSHPYQARTDARRQVQKQDQGGDDYYDQGPPLDPHEDDMYDDAPSSRRRGGLITVLALVGCAMMGTAAAYGYRSFYSDTGPKEPPPVITADTNTPTKIVPTGNAASPEAQGNKSISERFVNAAPAKERVVTRQEEPVALNAQSSAPAPRVVLPSPVTPAAPPQAAAPAQAAPPPAAATPSANGSEGGPKRVRTVTIRPDGTDVSGRPVGASPAPAARNTAPAPKAAPAPTQSRNSSGPLSLDPQAAPTETATTPAPAPVRERTASRAAPNREQQSSAGGYLVQISSQTNERDAQASFRSLQAKFPDELGGRQPVIRRVEISGKGTFYRTNVGPFASVQEATQFCARYKSAGGQCVVPRN